MSFRRIKLIIEYDGSCFHGWQIQNNAITVQEEIEKAILRITGEKIRITGAGRTDAGVHAFGQTAHFDTESKIPADRFSKALNAVLPLGIAVISSEEVPGNFHARFSAVSKVYEYKILNRYHRSPLMVKRVWHVREPLNIQNMNKAAAAFLGHHDFSAFCGSGHSVSTFERTIYSSQWVFDGSYLIYRVSGNGFLYNMVRIMTGTMVEIGNNKRSVDSIKELFLKKDRNLAGITAPPYGLYLVMVNYGSLQDNKLELQGEATALSTRQKL